MAPLVNDGSSLRLPRVVFLSLDCDAPIDHQSWLHEAICNSYRSTKYRHTKEARNISIVLERKIIRIH